MSTATSLARRSLWPLSLITAFALFVAGTAALVVLCARQDLDLVSPDYYEREVRHQEQINRRERARVLSAPARVGYDSVAGAITVALPADHSAGASGEIHLYRPSSAGLDRRVELKLDSAGRQVLDARTLAAGLWRVQVTWRIGGEDFELDQDVIVADKSS